jgi:hypothetical protein
MKKFPGLVRVRSLGFRRNAAVIALLSFFVLACDRSPTAPAELLVNEVILAMDDGSFAFSHMDHWHGAPTVRAGSGVGVNLHFTSLRQPADEHDPAPIEQWFTLAGHPEYSVRVVVEDTTIGRWSGDRVRGTLNGLQAGASRMTIVVLRGTTTIYEAAPLNFIVQPQLAGASAEPPE